MGCGGLGWRVGGERKSGAGFRQGMVCTLEQNGDEGGCGGLMGSSEGDDR